jgi:hypothetical protein
MFPQISNTKIREGLFNDPDIKKITNGRNVEVLQGTLFLTDLWATTKCPIIDSWLS